VDHTEAEKKVWMELESQCPHLDAEYTADDVGQVAPWYQATMGKDVDTTANKITIFTRSKTPCNSHINARSKAVGRE